MPTKFGTPAYWHERAFSARAIAEEISDAEARRAMLIVAENYERIAKRAQATEAIVMAPSNKGAASRT